LQLGQVALAQGSGRDSAWGCFGLSVSSVPRIGEDETVQAEWRAVKHQRGGGIGSCRKR